MNNEEPFFHVGSRGYITWSRLLELDDFLVGYLASSDLSSLMLSRRNRRQVEMSGVYICEAAQGQQVEV